VEVATRHSQIFSHPVYAIVTRCMTDCNLYRMIGTVLKQHCFEGPGPEFTSPSEKRLTFLPWHRCIVPILLYLLWTIILVLWKKKRPKGDVCNPLSREYQIHKPITMLLCTNTKKPRFCEPLSQSYIVAYYMDLYLLFAFYKAFDLKKLYTFLTIDQIGVAWHGGCFTCQTPRHHSAHTARRLSWLDWTFQLCFQSGHVFP
jgi:hypothetical protein